MTAVYTAFEEFCSELKRCSDCCSGDYLSIHCPLCPVLKYKPRQLSKVKKHLTVHWQTGVQGQNGSYAVICHLDHDGIGSSKSHFHCPTCGKIIVKKDNLKNHVKTCTQRLSSHSTDESHCVGEQNQNKMPAMDPTEVDVSDEIQQSKTDQSDEALNRADEDNFSKKKPCSVCGKRVSSRWLKAHLRQHNKENCSIGENRHHHTVVVSPKEGIFCSAINIKGPSYPVHTMKKTGGDSLVSFCDNLLCIELKQTAVRGGNMAFECPHLQSTPFSIPGRQIDMKEESLQEMKDINFITDARHIELLAYKNDIHESPMVVQIPSDSESSQRHVYLSIYTGTQRYWSKIGRTIVAYDTTENRYTCRCSPSKRYCVHKAIGKWFIFQEMPQFFCSVTDSEEEEDREDEQHQGTLEFSNKPQKSKENFKKSDISIQYMKTKKIPAKLPKTAQAFAFSSDQIEVRPKETECHLCKGNLTEENVSKRAKIILTTTIIRDITVYHKVCPRCRTIYNYQEWTEGLHNYNNITFLGLDLCSFLRAGLKNHVALGRSIDMLEDMLGEKLNSMEIQQAYLHFEVMTDHNYDFNCIICGYHPSILIWDTFRKARFRYAVSELKVPKSDEANETVDIESFWDSIEHAILLKGINSDLSKQQILQPSFENWSPWIGKKSRIGEKVFNTEYKKCVENSSKEIEEAMPEELLVHLLIDEKVSNIRRICKEAGVKSNGSAMDMILRLRQMSISRSSFDKAYEKVFGCSGGWAVGCCHHGIVYGIKNLLRSESPRDYVDMERSLKYRPNITICDIAHLVASHANKIIPDFYTPNNGRLNNSTEETISAAESGEIIYSAPFLTMPCSSESEDNQNINPTTGSDVHLALFDWFHQDNCKRREEILRKCSFLKEISGLIDTQAVEQLFSTSKRDIYFLNNMLPSNHLFVFRLIYHLRNEKMNEEMMEKQQRTFGSKIIYNEFGQIAESVGMKSFAEQEENSSQAGKEVPIYFAEKITSIPVINKSRLEVSDFHIPAEDTDNMECLRRQFHVQEFAYVKEIIEAIFISLPTLSEDEQRNFSTNIKYASRFLFASATDDRHLQLNTIATPYGLFQQQGTSNYCGLCSVNNAIGITERGPIVTIEQMDDTADRLWLQMVDNPACGITSVALEPMRDREGFYSFEVLQAVLQRHGKTMIHMNENIISGQSPLEVGMSVSQHLKSEYGEVVLIIRLNGSQHWITIKEIRNDFFLMDSKKDAPQIIDIEDLGNHVISNIRHPGACFFLTPSEAEVYIDEVTDKNSKQMPHVQEEQEESTSSKFIYDIGEQEPGLKEKRYELRMNPSKKRRSSFFYQSLKKKTKIQLKETRTYPREDFGFSTNRRPMLRKPRIIKKKRTEPGSNMNAKPMSTNWLCDAVIARTIETQRMTKLMCYIDDNMPMTIIKGASVICGHSLLTLFEDVIKEKLMDMINTENGDENYYRPHWRHYRWINDTPLCHHLEMRNNMDGECERENLFGHDGLKELNALVLSSFGIWKVKTKWRIGYPAHGHFLAIRETKNQKLLNKVEDVMGQNLNYGRDYFVDVLFTEAQIIAVSSVKNITITDADKLLYPLKEKKKK